MKILLYSIVASAALIFTFSCNKTSLVGSDLFVPDSIELDFEDNFDIAAKTIFGDSVVTYNGTSSRTSLILGELSDPVFGQTVAEAYTDLNLLAGSTVDFKFFDEDSVIQQAVLDSVVLILSYQESAFYGDSTLAHDVEVSILEDDIFDVDSLYSNFRPESESRLIGNKTLIPSLGDSIFILEPGDTSETGYANQFRMTLENDWVQEMFDDTSLINSGVAFNDYAPGLKITSKSSGSSTWGFAYGTTSTAGNNVIRIYYTKDTIRESYDIIVNGNGHNFYEHDYAGSELEEFVESEEKGDSLLFLQGLTGTEIELDLPFLENSEFGDFLINQAELEFFVLEDETFDIHHAIESISMSRYTEEGELVVLEDAFLDFSTDILENFTFDGNLGSKLVNGSRIKKYSAFITIYTMERIEESTPFNRIVITPRNKSVIPNRSIIYGPGHSTYPMKFKLNYSK